MTDIASTPDGVHAMVPEDTMCAAARKLRAAYAITPGAPFVQREFGFYCLERWAEQGMPADVARAELFGYDPSGGRSIGGLDWCEAAFTPAFEEKVLEDRGKYELVQDFAGRHVLCFKGRRSGFMPEYVDHPVKDTQTWQELYKWRLDPTTPTRFETLDTRMASVREAAAATSPPATMACPRKSPTRITSTTATVPWNSHDRESVVQPAFEKMS